MRIDNLERKGSQLREGDLQGKTEGGEGWLRKLKEECRMAVIDQFDQVQERLNVKTERTISNYGNKFSRSSLLLCRVSTSLG